MKYSFNKYLAYLLLAFFLACSPDVNAETVDFAKNATFTYDKSGRLIYTSLGESFSYDSKGNLERRFTSSAFGGSGQVPLTNLTVNTAAGGKNTVEFWMYWDGSNSVMPFSWNTNYALWLTDGFFGFNTGQSNILGIPSAGLNNLWVHVAAVFYNGVPDATNNELYIDDVKQNLSPVMGTTSFTVAVTNSAFVSGDAANNHKMGGRIGEVRIWNYPLTESEVRGNRHMVLNGTETGLAGYWRGMLAIGFGVRTLGTHASQRNIRAN